MQRVLPEDDRCVVRVDHLDKETILEARPDTASFTTRPAYAKGDHLIVLHKNVCRDAIVLEWLGDGGAAAEMGGRHRIRYAPLDADRRRRRRAARARRPRVALAVARRMRRRMRRMRRRRRPPRSRSRSRRR